MTTPPAAPRIIVLGGLNMDLMIETPRLARAGETTEGTRFYTTPGGKGGNQAVAAARMSGRHGEMAMVAKVGTDSFGEEMTRYLEHDGIEVSRVRQQDGVASGIAAIFIDASGQNYVNAVYGANATCDEQQAADVEALLGGASVLLVQQEVSLAVTERAMRAARALGVTVILDPAPTRDAPAGFHALPSIITPNQLEAEAMSGIAVTDAASAQRAARAIRALGCATVIVTCGEDGAHVEADGVSALLPAYRVPVVATVGAGDAFNGGLAAGLAEGLPLLDAARLGIASGAICVSRDGAQAAMGTRAEAEALVHGGDAPPR